MFSPSLLLFDEILMDLCLSSGCNSTSSKESKRAGESNTAPSSGMEVIIWCELPASIWLDESVLLLSTNQRKQDNPYPNYNLHSDLHAFLHIIQTSYYPEMAYDGTVRNSHLAEVGLAGSHRWAQPSWWVPVAEALCLASGCWWFHPSPHFCFSLPAAVLSVSLFHTQLEKLLNRNRALPQEFLLRLGRYI